MSSKSTSLFVLACFLLVSTQVYGSKHAKKEACSDPPAVAPTTPPVPTYSPTPTPVTAAPPTYTGVPLPPVVPPPTYSSPGPIVSPIGPIIPPRSHLGYCVPKCEQKCKKHRRIRPCVRICTQCCEENKRCVPVAGETCPNWTVTMYHGNRRSCP